MQPVHEVSSSSEFAHKVTHSPLVFPGVSIVSDSEDAGCSAPSPKSLLFKNYDAKILRSLPFVLCIFLIILAASGDNS